MTPESRQFLAYLAAQPKGRVGFWSYEYQRARELASEALEAGHVKFRPLHPRPFGFQITAAGKAYLAGESADG